MTSEMVGVTHLAILVRCEGPGETGREGTLAHSALSRQNQHLPLHRLHPLSDQRKVRIRSLGSLCTDSLVGTSVTRICLARLRRLDALRQSARPAGPDRDMSQSGLTGQCSGAFSGTVDGSTVDDGSSGSGEGGGSGLCNAIMLYR